MQYIYTNEELPQKSDEWLALRTNKIGGSDVAAILGLSKYEKASTVWKRKTGRLKPKSTNAAMKRGAEMEDEAVENVLDEIRLSGIDSKGVNPLVAIHPKHDSIMVSFDGVDLDNKFIVEVKCPQFSGNFKSVFMDGIPDHYYPQVQLQLFVSNEHWGITKAYFGSYYPDGAYITNYISYTEDLKTLALIDQDYDEEYCNAMVPVIDKFADNVKYNHWNDEEYQEVVERFKRKVQG